MHNADWFSIMAEPKTLAEALKMKTVNLTQDFVKNVLGDAAVWPVLAEKFELKTASLPVSKSEAVARYLKAS